MFAASSVGMTSRFAVPVSRLSGTARSRIASTSAASACISPSISSSGARARISASAARILRADSLIAGAEAGMRQQRRLRRDAESAHRLGRQQRHLGDLLGGRIDHHVRVADEQRAALQDQAGQRIDPR